LPLFATGAQTTAALRLYPSLNLLASKGSNNSAPICYNEIFFLRLVNKVRIQIDSFVFRLIVKLLTRSIKLQNKKICH